MAQPPLPAAPVLPPGAAVAGTVLPPPPSRPPPRGPSPSYAKFVYTPEELRATPSILDGLAYDEERRARYDSAVFMGRLAEEAGLPEDQIVEILGTAMLLFQRFFARRSLTRFDKYIMATVCVFHSLKITAEEKCMQHAWVMAVAYHKVALGRAVAPGSEACIKTASEVACGELRLLEALEYEFPDPHADLAWGYLGSMVAALNSSSSGSGLPQELVIRARKTIAECMRTTLPLSYDPPTLAAAALRIVLARASGPGVPPPEAVEAAVPLAPGVAQDVMATLSAYLQLFNASLAPRPA